MKPTGLLVACGVLSVLGGLVWWTKEHPKKTESTTPDAPKVLALGEDQIEEITLSKPGAEPITLKKNGGKWQITAPQPLSADQETVKGLVAALANIQSDRLIDLKPENLAAFGLTEPKAETGSQISAFEYASRQSVPSATPHGLACLMIAQAGAENSATNS